MNQNKVKLLIVGATPESTGVGGVTMHVERLLQYLDKKGFAYELFEYKKASIFSVLKIFRHSEIIHLHICNPYYMFLLSLICKLLGKNYIMTLHGKYVEGVQRPWPLISFCIKNARIPIVLNHDSFEACQKINNKTVLIPAFIPPQKKERLESEIVEMVDAIHAKDHKVVVTYGGKVRNDVNGQEIYGIDFLVSYFKSKDKFELIISDPTGDYSRKYTERFANIHFIDHPHSLYELIKITDVFVRNTSKDGDSLSVKEALYLKKPVLCTDVVERPEGVLLFKYSDICSFDACMNESEREVNTIVESGEEKLLNLYRTMI